MVVCDNDPFHGFLFRFVLGFKAFGLCFGFFFRFVLGFNILGLYYML